MHPRGIPEAQAQVGVRLKQPSGGHGGIELPCSAQLDLEQSNFTGPSQRPHLESRLLSHQPVCDPYWHVFYHGRAQNRL
jgi:hypothetical protein